MTSSSLDGDYTHTKNLREADSASIFLETKPLTDDIASTLSWNQPVASVTGTLATSTADSSSVAVRPEHDSDGGAVATAAEDPSSLPAVVLNHRDIDRNILLDATKGAVDVGDESSDDSDIGKAGVGFVAVAHSGSADAQSSLSDEVLAAATVINQPVTAIASRKHTDEAPLSFTQKVWYHILFNSLYSRS
jgi:hypothetical protein